SLRHLAELALLRGHTALALQHLERAQRLFAGREDQRGLLDVSLLRARVALAEQRHAEAAALLEPLLSDVASLSAAQASELSAVAAVAATGAGDTGRAATLQQQAAEQARAAGVPLLSLQAELLGSAQGLPGAADSGTVLERARAFGNVPLLLRALDLRLERAPADAVAVQSTYREALSLLRRVGDYAGAAGLHSAAAGALSRSGQEQAAAEAHDAAAAAARPGAAATGAVTGADDGN